MQTDRLKHWKEFEFLKDLLKGVSGLSQGENEHFTSTPQVLDILPMSSDVHMTTESAFERKSHYYEAHQTDKLTFDLCTDFVVLLQHFSMRVKCLNTPQKNAI